MNKNELKNAIEDIYDDFKIYRTRYYTNKSDSTKFAVILLLLPHILGIVIGCAFARLFNLKFVGYIISCAIFALLVGIHKSTYDDKISLKYAIIKNIVLISIEIISASIYVMIYGFMDRI